MNIETIERIVALVSGHPVSEITVEHGGERVHVRKSSQRPQTVSAADLGAEAVASDADGSASGVDVPEPMAADREPEPIVLTSPMVGLFHHLAQPIPYGGVVVLHQVVGSVESMKLMNDVLAEHGGRVVEVLIEDGAPVEYGQPLFRLMAA